MLQPRVINSHAGQHGDKAGNGPPQLPQKEKIPRVVALLRHDRGGAENHHQANKDQQQRNDKQQPVDTDSFSHSEINSITEMLIQKKFLPWILRREGNYRGSLGGIADAPTGASPRTSSLNTRPRCS